MGKRKGGGEWHQLDGKIVDKGEEEEEEDEKEEEIRDRQGKIVLIDIAFTIYECTLFSYI